MYTNSHILCYKPVKEISILATYLGSMCTTIFKQSIPQNISSDTITANNYFLQPDSVYHLLTSST